MDNLAQHKGFIVHCDLQGKVLNSKMDNLLSLTEGDSLIKHVDPASIGKLLSFLTKVGSEESAIGWEVNFKNKSTFHSVYLAGIKEEENITVIGTTDAEETRKYFNDLTLISNQQVSELRNVIKENLKYKEDKTTDDSSFNELTKINNEMANLQRELAKKNQVLADLNLKLETANNELEQFAYIVSHDLKAPLRGIVGVVDMIIEDYANNFDEDLIDMFGLITQRSKRMDELITAILSYARAGKMDTEISTFELDELFKEILDAIAAPEAYSFEFPKILPSFTCSYIQLSQVLTNLMGNAVKYHDKPNGVIRVDVEPATKGLFRISVTDDGPGIPEEFHHKVFGAFETANQASRTDSTGIGLAIVQKLVEQNGGEIGLISEIGSGSTFWFTWPQNTSVAL